MSRKLTIQDFIKRSNLIHNNKYDYSLVEYKNNSIKIKIICPIHGIFEQTPASHLIGCGCTECKYEIIKQKISLTTEEFIEKAKLIHGNKYDYSKAIYIKNSIKIKIICLKHGQFEQQPNNHLNAKGCPKCGNEKLSLQKRMSLNEFTQRASQIHNNKYDYNLVEYINNHTKVCIVCPSHGEFWQIPNAHLEGMSGCPSCNDSKGEVKIKEFLEENNIKFISPFRFKDCKNIKPLPFDFYLPDHKICIEYDGIQHFKEFNYFGGEEKFIKQQQNDKIKTQYCLTYGIKLIRIPYTKFKNIKLVLSKEI